MRAIQLPEAEAAGVGRLWQIPAYFPPSPAFSETLEDSEVIWGKTEPRYRPRPHFSPRPLEAVLSNMVARSWVWLLKSSFHCN